MGVAHVSRRCFRHAVPLAALSLLLLFLCARSFRSLSGCRYWAEVCIPKGPPPVQVRLQSGPLAAPRWEEPPCEGPQGVLGRVMGPFRASLNPEGDVSLSPYLAGWKALVSPPPHTQVPNSPRLHLRLRHERGLCQGDSPRGAGARPRGGALLVAGGHGGVGAAGRTAGAARGRPPRPGPAAPSLTPPGPRRCDTPSTDPGASSPGGGPPRVPGRWE
ncbi:glycolipid transfer protein domain-containing protein 2 [Suricata suricatta]|uniref:glycolipid transfer protein domain-containing protein 2 n=1 Tax=Suricata suricatta TaxID=37032 RepID=UPI001155800A|nr:glycolipid transfer protein domain-containing protein 2 [Suricata suricatta]